MFVLCTYVHVCGDVCVCVVGTGKTACVWANISVGSHAIVDLECYAPLRYIFDGGGGDKMSIHCVPLQMFEFFVYL